MANEELNDEELDDENNKKKTKAKKESKPKKEPKPKKEKKQKGKKDKSKQKNDKSEAEVNKKSSKKSNKAKKQTPAKQAPVKIPKPVEDKKDSLLPQRVAIVGLIVFMATLIGVSYFGLGKVDVKVIKALGLDTATFGIVTQSIVKWLAFLGSATVVVFILLMSMLTKTWRNTFGYAMATTAGVSSLINVIIKNMVHRPRPSFNPIIIETGYSFPSGHAMNNMALYGFVAILALYYIRNNALRYTAAFVAIFFAVSVAISRVVAGVHYPTDIVAGMALGVSIACIMAILFNIRGQSKKYHIANYEKAMSELGETGAIKKSKKRNKSKKTK